MNIENNLPIHNIKIYNNIGKVVINKNIDNLAAAYILQGFLDKYNYKNSLL